MEDKENCLPTIQKSNGTNARNRTHGLSLTKRHTRKQQNGVKKKGALYVRHVT